MKFTYRFRSVLMSPVIGPEGEPTGALSFDPASVQEHCLVVGPAALILDRGWAMAFVISLLVVVPLFAILYGFMLLGLKLDPGANALAGRLFILSALLFFLVLWTVLGRGHAVRNCKWRHVVEIRGAGAWKLVDEAKWRRFEALMVMGAAAREEE